MTTRLLTGDCRDVLPTLAAESFDCVVTSPPYWGLRDYGVDGQIGLEPTLDAYVDAMAGVARELWRVLKPQGTFWLNLGDCYAGSWGAQSRGGAPSAASTLRGNGHIGGGPKLKSLSAVQIAAHPQGGTGTGSLKLTACLKPKDLCLVPSRVALRLQADGWFLRSKIIWAKPNPMPESVTDRPTSAYEEVLLLTKSARYAYDAAAIAEQAISDHKSGNGYGRPEQVSRGGRGQASGWDDIGGSRNARNVWTIASQPYKGAHFATMPPALAERCILAGCPERVCAACGGAWVRKTERVSQGWDGSRYGERAVAATGGAKSGGTAASTLGSSNGRLTGKIKTLGFAPSCNCDADSAAGHVLDPFGGSGTTGLVADRLGRHATLIDLNPTYEALQRERLMSDAPLLVSMA